MKFFTKPIDKIYKNEVHITSTVDPNDGDDVTKNSTMSEKDFDDNFEVFLKLGKIIGENHGLQKLFDSFEDLDDDDESKYIFSDLLWLFLPHSVYSEYGNNSFGHTLITLDITYYDSTGTPFEVDLKKPLENI